MLVAQSCLTLCNATDCSSPGFSIYGILQARILEWIATPFSREPSQPRDWTLVSCIEGLFVTIWATGKSYIKINITKLLPLRFDNLIGKKVKVKSLHRVFATPWTVAYQAPQSMELSRQKYWSGLPFPSPGDLPNPGIKPRSPAFQADALPSEPLMLCCVQGLLTWELDSDSKRLFIPSSVLGMYILTSVSQWELFQVNNL